LQQIFQVRDFFLKMQLCLIFPQSTFLEDPMVFPPLGLWWLWSVLEQAGHEVSFIDMSEHGLEPKDIPYGFDAYLVSGTSPQGREIRKLGAEFQRRGVPAILGGPHGTNYPRNSRKYYPLVVRREGEAAVLRAVATLERGEPFECLSRVLAIELLTRVLIPGHWKPRHLSFLFFHNQTISFWA
jgi:radical SAM superfamily enzyme YgiQ (UPF0313 family)